MLKCDLERNGSVQIIISSSSKWNWGLMFINPVMECIADLLFYLLHGQTKRHKAILWMHKIRMERIPGPQAEGLNRINGTIVDQKLRLYNPAGSRLHL